jgi:carboxyl-terminal processing protease
MLHRFLIIIFLLISNIAIAETNNEEDKKIENLPNAEYYKQYEAVVDLIDKNYVQEPPDKQKMTDAALNAMLLELDPHSTYLTGEDLEDLLTHTKGEFGGIGVEIMYENGAIKIISALDDLPAHKANMETGDYIVGVNDEFVSNLGFYKSVKAMRGEPGTKVKLLVIKHDETKPKDIELIRETVKISPVKTSLEKNNVAYVRIKTFNEHTYKELKENIEKLKIDTNNDIKGIILDLRNNGGGLLNQAILVSEYFINNGIVVSTKGKAAGTSQEFFASKNSAKAPNVPMIILINGGSASASEIVAGALQDYKRGLIIGTKSFGKGSVQTLLPINNNAAVKLTTSKYYTPSGRSIQAEGILPDIIIDNAKVEFSKSSESDKIFSEKSLRGYLKNDTKEKIQNDLKDKNNNKIFDKKSVEKNKKPDNINNKKNDDELSELYKSDYQFARAFDIIMGLILTNNK